MSSDTGRRLQCNLCSQLSDVESAVQHVQAEPEDTHLPDAAKRLEVVRQIGPKEELYRCPECRTYYSYRTDYEFLIGFGGSYDEEVLTRLDEAALGHLKSTPYLPYVPPQARAPVAPSAHPEPGESAATNDQPDPPGEAPAAKASAPAKSGSAQPKSAYPEPAQPEKLSEAERLIRDCRDRSPETRLAAALRLQDVGDHLAVPELERVALEDRGEVELDSGGFVGRAELIYEAALQALRAIYQREGVTPEDITRMTSLISDRYDYPNGTYRVLALGGDGIRPLLREALESAEPRAVIRAMKTLAILDEPGIGEAQLWHSDIEVRRAAAGLWPPPGPHWVRALARRLPVEPDALLRLRLLRAVAPYRTAEDVLVLLRCRTDEGVSARAVAAELLEALSPDERWEAIQQVAEEALDWLRREPDPSIRQNILRSVPLLPHAPAAAVWLEAQRRDPDPETRRLARRQLARRRKRPGRP